MHFGPYSVALTIAIGNGWLLAALLWSAGGHRRFLRALAILVALMTLRLVPYMIGFAGAYDRWQWLTFAPVDASLAFGPLIWLYVVSLSTGARPAQWRWHLVPMVVQLAYQVVAFTLPLETKWEWYTTWHLRVVEPIGFAAALLSMLLYSIAAQRQFARWQRWMDENLSNREAFRLGVVRVVLIGTAATTVVAAGVALRSWFVVPADYVDRLPAVLALALLTYVLGLSGWRQSSMAFPVMTNEPATAPDGAELVVTADPETDPVRPSVRQPATDTAAPSARAAGRPRRDYAETGAQWMSRISAEDWFREPDLTLAEVARRLNVSPRTATRVLGDGLGVTFHELINRLRVEAVQREMDGGGRRRDLLSLALDAGFASKASFNRAFRDVTGTSPSQRRNADTPRPAATESDEMS